MAAQSLVFQNTTFTPVDRNQQPWLKAAEIAQALGYANENAVSKIYNRNKDEFTEAMSLTVNLGVKGNPKRPNLGLSENLQTETRIFSLRGAHLIGMFARTALAKEFRVWVLDILDQHTAAVPQNVIDTLLPSEQQTLKEIVDRKLAAVDGKLQGKARAELWSRVQNKFRVAQYSQIPRHQLADAIVYITGMELKCLPAPEKPYQPNPEDYLTNHDERQMRRMIYFISNRFHHEQSAAFGVWRALRTAAGCPAPFRFEGRHLPALADEFRRLMRIADNFRDVVNKAETACIKQLLRDRADEAALLARMERELMEIATSDQAALGQYSDTFHDREIGELLGRNSRFLSMDHPELAESAVQ